jgi:hypothetical protein
MVPQVKNSIAADAKIPFFIETSPTKAKRRQFLPTTPT